MFVELGYAAVPVHRPTSPGGSFSPSEVEFRPSLARPRSQPQISPEQPQISLEEEQPCDFRTRRSGGGR
jgi:hypothetical protein